MTHQASGPGKGVNHRAVVRSGTEVLLLMPGFFMASVAPNRCVYLRTTMNCDESPVARQDRADRPTYSRRHVSASTKDDIWDWACLH
jgi:hypothetical protein